MSITNRDVRSISIAMPVVFGRAASTVSREVAAHGGELRQTLVAIADAHEAAEAAKPSEPDLIDQLRLARRAAL